MRVVCDTCDVCPSPSLSLSHRFSDPNITHSQVEELEREVSDVRMESKRQVAEARKEAAEALQRCACVALCDACLREMQCGTVQSAIQTCSQFPGFRQAMREVLQCMVCCVSCYGLCACGVACAAVHSHAHVAVPHRRHVGTSRM